MTTVQKIIKYLAVAFAIMLIVAIFGGILNAIGLISLFTGNDSDISDSFNEIAVSSQITELDIEVGAADFEIKTAERFYIETNKKSLNVKEKSGKLEITDKSKPGLNSDKIKITLYIPENTALKSTELSTGAGRVAISALNTEKLDMELGAGEFTAQSIVATAKTEIDGGAGKLTISGSSLKNLDFDMGVGEADIEAKITGINQLDLGVGSTKLTVNGNKEDYSIELNKGIGKATIVGQELKNGTLVGDGPNVLKINGGIGEIKLDFAPAV